MKLLLFDIDGTIIQPGQLDNHLDAFLEGINKIYGVKIEEMGSDYHGSTDRQIIYSALDKKDLKKEDIEPKIKQCMDVMVNYYKSCDNSNLAVVDDIENLLEGLSQNNNLLIGLLTGNVEGIAYEKMKILGLKDYFKVGGFGSDKHEKRSDLVDVARKKSEKLGYNVDKIYVIGDTPKDIQAGKEANEKLKDIIVEEIAVATGPYPIDALKKYNSNHLFKKLDVDNLNKIFNGGN